MQELLEGRVWQTVTTTARRARSLTDFHTFFEFMSDSKPSSIGEIPTLPSAILKTMSAIVFVLVVLAIPVFSRMALPHSADDIVVGLCMMYALAFPVGVWRTYRSMAIRASAVLDQAVDEQNHLDTRLRALQQEAEARKAIEARLQLALDTQSRQLATQRDFSAMVSHELRTPLSVIDLASQSLQLMELGQLPDAAKRIERIRSAVSRLDALASGLQSIERLDRDAANRRFARVNLAEVAGKVAASLSFGQQLELKIDAAPVVSGDAGLLNIALSNLVENALKYAGAHGPVVVGVSSHGDEARITVRDHGPGIAETDLAHIFERFFRSDNTRHKPGAGQGLFLARRICETHGGTICARNMPDGGCEFVLAFPSSTGSASTW